MQRSTSTQASTLTTTPTTTLAAILALALGTLLTTTLATILTAGPTGLYEVSDFEGVSPTLQVKIGETLFFDQRDPSNWFHPLGFAYEPDGAHRRSPSPS